MLDALVGLCCDTGFTASANVADSLCKCKLLCTHCTSSEPVWILYQTKESEVSEQLLHKFPWQQELAVIWPICCHLGPIWCWPFWSYTTGDTMALLTNYCLIIQPQNNQHLKNVNKLIKRNLKEIYKNRNSDAPFSSPANKAVGVKKKWHISGCMWNYTFISKLFRHLFSLWHELKTQR